MPDQNNAIVRFFKWWNTAMRSDSELTPENFARLFTDDARLIVNGALRAQGPEPLASHYRNIQSQLDDVQMVLPVEHTFQNGENIFVHCYTHAVADGREIREEAMAYALTENDKIRLLRVVGK